MKDKDSIQYPFSRFLREHIGGSNNAHAYCEGTQNNVKNHHSSTYLNRLREYKYHAASKRMERHASGCSSVVETNETIKLERIQQVLLRQYVRVGKIWVFGMRASMRKEPLLPDWLYTNESETGLAAEILIHKEDASTYEEGCGNDVNNKHDPMFLKLLFETIHSLRSWELLR